MKKNLILFSILPLVYFLLNHAQLRGQTGYCGELPPNTATGNNPDSIYYDRFGNSYDVGQTNSFVSSSTCIAGYYELTFFDIPINLQPTICQVFMDLSGLIPQRVNFNQCGDLTENEMVKIEVKNEVSFPTLGAGTSYYSSTPINNNCQGMVGRESQANNIINGGYAGGNTIFDFNARLDINTESFINWYTGTPPVPGGTFDLYSLVLHEAMHILGFASFQSAGTPATSLWDQNIFVAQPYNTSGPSTQTESILVSDCQSNCWELNPALFSGFSDLTNLMASSCSSSGTDIVFGETGIAPLLGTHPSGSANALSHFDVTCNGQNIDYVVQSSLPQGIDRRSLTVPEMDILCTLGYEVSGHCDGCYIVGGSLLQGNGTNSEYYENCCHEEDFYTCFDEALTLSFDDILCTISTNSSSYSIVEAFASPVSGGGSPTVTILSGTSEIVIDFSGVSTSGVYSIEYTVVGCDCRMSYGVFNVMVGPCLTCPPPATCDNLTCTNGFEDFDVGSQSTVLNTLGAKFFYDEGGSGSNTPDICSANNNKFIKIVGGEAFALNLHEPIEPECSAIINFKASASASSGGKLFIFGSSNVPCAPWEGLVNWGCAPTDCGGYTYNQICIAEETVTDFAPVSSTGACPTDPNFGDHSVVWENQTTELIEYIVFATDPNLIWPFINIDDIVVTKGCINANFSHLIDCPDVQFNSSPNSGNVTHLWDFGDGNSSTEPSPFHAYAVNGTFTVEHTVIDECGYEEKETLDVFIDCLIDPEEDCSCPNNSILIGTPGDETLLSTEVLVNSTLPANPTNALNLVIQGTLVIDANVVTGFSPGYYNFPAGSQICMAPGAAIKIPELNELEVFGGSHLRGCGQRWEGIILDGLRATLTLSGGGGIILVEDAQYAIRPIGGFERVEIENTLFDKNYVGIFDDGSGSGDFNLLMNGAIFDCSANLLPHYDASDPNDGPTSFAGMYIQDYGLMNIGLNGAVNTFSNLIHGILAEGTNLRVQNTLFNNIGWGGGIRSINNGGYLNTPSGAPNTFTDCVLGIWARRTYCSIYDNQMTGMGTGIHVEDCLNFHVVIRGNTISADGYGIEMLRNDGGFVSVRGNDVTIVEQPPGLPGVATPEAISIEELGIGHGTLADVEDNQCTLNAGWAGIAIRTGADYKVSCNNITINSGADTGYSGILISGCSNTDVLVNDVNGAGAGSASNAMSITSCFNGLYDNNELNGTETGLLFDMPCPGTELKLTRFGSHAFGLHYLALASTGRQPDFMFNSTLPGNRWNGPIAGARHDTGNPNVLLDNQYTVPLLSQPKGPGPIQAVNPSSWFVLPSSPREEHTVFLACAQLPPIGARDKNLNLLDEQIASGNFATDGYDATMTWIVERYLYGHLLNDGGLIQPGSVFETFFNNKGNTTIENFEAVDQQFRSLFLLDSAETAQLDALIDQRGADMDTLTIIEGQLATATGQDFENLLSQRDGLVGQLKTTINNLDVLLQGILNDRLTEAQALVSQNLAINTTEIYELNEQVVNGGILKWVQTGGLDAATLASLENVASQCPYSGGTAVFRARSFLAGQTEMEFDNSACTPAPPQSFGLPNSGNRTGSFSVHPNPTTDGFTLSIGQKMEKGVKYKALLTDIHGRTVGSKTLQVGDSSTDFGTNGLSAGVYFLKVTDHKEVVFSTKIVVQ